MYHGNGFYHLKTSFFHFVLYLFLNDWWLILIVFSKSLGLLYVSVIYIISDFLWQNKSPCNVSTLLGLNKILH